MTVGANGQLGLFGTTTNSPRVVLNGGAIYGTGNATLASVLAGPVVLASNSYMGDMYIYSATAALTTHEQMDGEVSGPGALFKGGTNTLFLNASNSYTGDTIVFGGKLTLTGKGSLASPNIFVTSNGVFDVTAQPGFTLAAGQSLHGNSAVVGQVAVGPGSFVQPGTNSIGTLTISSNLVLNGGTLVCEIGSVTNEGGIYNDLLTVAGNLNLAALTTLQLHLTAGTIDTVNPYTLINYAGALQGNTANLTVTSDSRYTFTPDFSVAGKVRVKVTGGGPADLLWAGNYPEIQADWDVAVSPYWNGSQVFYQGDSVTFDNATGSFDVNLVGSLRPRSMLFKANEVTYTFIGAGALGGGAITKIQNGSYTFANSGVNAFTGPLDIQEGTIRFGDGGILGNLPMTVVVTNNGTLAFNRSDTVTVGNPIVGVGTVVQEGSGLLVLSGSRTFLGGVLVNNGTVQCDGTLLAGAGTVTVAGGMLSGTGTIPAPVLVQAAGVIAPGPGRGTLTISSTLTLAGQARMEINKFGATLASDQVRGVSTLTYGGTLVVQASGDALTAGDAFKLFDATTYTGAFASTNLPVLAAGLGWDTSSLAVDGTIRVQHLYLVTGQIALEGYVGLAQDGVGTRAVTFTATTNGLVLGSWTLDLNFAGGVASYSLPSVLANAANLSAKTAWHLRKRLPMDLSSGSATVNFTDPNQLLAGDLTGTNGVDLDDYYRLAAVWYQVNDAADIDGSGKVDLDDYFLLGNRWGQQDEAP